MKLIVRTVLVSGAVPALALLAGAPAHAASNPSGTGQPSASCQDFQATPTSPLLVPGFNTAGFTHATTVYAGSDGTASLLHANSTHAVSQYDVACYQRSQH